MVHSPGEHPDLAALEQYVAVLEAAAVTLEADPVAAEQAVALAGRLGSLTARLEFAASQASEEPAWLRTSLQPNSIAQIAPLLTWSGFRTLSQFYTILEANGLLPAGLSQAELHAWFKVVQGPIAAHIAATTGREVLWAEEGNTWTLSFIERGWGAAEEAVPESAGAPASTAPDGPPAQTLEPTPPPAAAAPPPALTEEAPPRPDRRQDKPLTTEELEVARVVIELLLPQTPRDPAMPRTRLLAEVRARLGVSRARSTAFDAGAKTLLGRLVRRGVIASTSQRHGSFRDDLVGNVRAAWQQGLRGQNVIVESLRQPYPPETEG